ncbi:MAG TPA: hypothetical protein VGG84_14490 [Gemmatimonadaceae bacterium]|jgi:hypothetical protein
MKFALADVVLIRRLLTPVRDVDGDSAEPPQPRLGELGTVTASVGDDLYLVEHATDDGRSLWVAEFHAEELALVDRPTP